MTNLPPVKNCILCEDVRFEKGHKYSVMGMFGILPDATLLVQDFQAPIQRLAFLVLVDHRAGTYKLNIEIERPNNEKDSLAKEIILDIPVAKENPNETKGMMVIVKSGFIPKESGEFKFIIYSDNKLYFQSSFLVKQGTPKDLL
jgi:hypothetical protein